MFAGKPGLLACFRRGDRAALEAVYRACVRGVRRTVHAIVSSHVTAAELGDLVQEVFVRAFSPESRQRYDGNRPYEPYLGQIARNVVIDHWRVVRRQIPFDVVPLLEALSLEYDAAAGVPTRWADQQTIAVVDRFLASLDPVARRVHDAIYVQGLSQRDAATALGLGRQAVRGIDAKLRAGLRRQLDRG